VPSHTTPLHLYLLGAPEVHLGAKRLTFPTRKTLALLSYLALQGGEQPREHLAALLWPESSPERSHASLRNTLSHLQSALRLARGQRRVAYLSVTHHALALNPEADIQLDLQAVERAYSLARGDRGRRAPPEGSTSQPALQSAAACYRGDFLAGFSLGDAPGFDDWVASQREVWRRRLGLIFDRLSEIQFASGEFTSATETTARWITLDPLNEAAYRRKMRAHFAAGERGQALDAYAACHAILAAELSVEPEPETEALAARIRRQHAGAPPAARPDTPAAFLENLFAGRTAEYQTLIESYKRTAAGQPQVGTLQGEAGIGKTRLATEFLAWAGAQGAEVLQGCALESSSHLPFQPVVEALRSRLEREGALKDWLGQAWLAPLSELWPELRGRYPELLVAPKETPLLKAAAGRTQLFEAVVRLTLAWTQRAPLVLFVDDLQWADSATLDWLQYALRRWRESAARIMLLASLRPEVSYPLAPPLTGGGLREWLARVAREAKPSSLHLEPLSERDTTQMVLSILTPPTADFAQWVFDETRGQPFYLMETLKDLLERGVLHPKRQAKGQWTFAVDAEHDLGRAVRVPSTVRAVMRARLSRLSPNAFTLLAAGAVLEQQLTFDRLCAIANTVEDAGLPALDELVSGRLLLEATPPGGTSVFTFANDMLRNVVYTEAGDARRQLFHRRALEILEAAKVPAAVLVHHALAAGLTEAAVFHSLAAGREALRLSALAEARVHCQQAQQWVRDVSPVPPGFEAQIRDLSLELGQAYELGGQPAQAQALAAEWEKTVHHP
jgi:DNA-binding SARP family transcriptional activator